MDPFSLVYPSYDLFTPGPTPVAQVAKDALSICPPYYIDDENFFDLMKKVVFPGLKYLVQTEQNVYPLSCSGTGAMQIAVSSLCLKTDKILVLNGGRFGRRWYSICESFLFSPKLFNFKVFTEKVFQEFVTHVNNASYDIIFLPQVETSTGALLPVKRLSAFIKKQNPSCLIVVDVVSSLLVEEFKQDLWDIDCVVGSSQKALQLPPGLSFISFSSLAENKHTLVVNTTFSYNYYFNLRIEKEKYYPKGQTRFTPNIQGLVAFSAVIEEINVIGVSDIIHSHHRKKRIIQERLINLGYVCEDYSFMTDGIILLYCENPHLLKNYLKCNHRCLVASAPDELKEKAVRISLMGWDLDVSYFDNLLRGLEVYTEYLK